MAETFHPRTSPRAPRRAGLAAAAALLLIAACGGGDAGSGPLIHEFSADRSGDYFVGERARLRVRYAGGSGRIEPGFGAVPDGAEVDTGVLAESRRYRLVVEVPGLPAARRDLALSVVFRNRYQSFDAPAVSQHAAVATGDGGALVLGGSRGESVLSAAIERFDPAARRFTRIGTLATGRAGHSALRLAGGQVLVFGGVTSSSEAPFAELVDERTGSTVRAGTMVQPRSRHAAVALADGRVLAIGGANRDSIEIWSPATRSWRLVTQRMAHTREHASATLLADGRVLIVGGDTPAAGYVFAEVFDPRTERFTAVAGGPAEQRWLHGAYRLADGDVLVAAGVGRTGGNAVTLQSTVWRYRAASQDFAPMPALTAMRYFAAGVVTPDDELLLVGGQTAAEFSSATGVSYRAAASGSVQRALPLLPEPVLFHTATRLADGRVLVVGGEDHFGRFSARAALYD
jgi:hypothetical protein